MTHETFLYRQRPFGPLVSIFLLSFSSLFFEVTLTRLFSYFFVQSFVYLVISIGIAGIGLGAVCIYFIPVERSGRFFSLLPFTPPSIIVLILGINYFYPSIYISLVLTLLYFAGIGSGIAFLFKYSPLKSGYLYAADLTGAAAGSVASFLALQMFGPWKAVVLISLVTVPAYLIILAGAERIRLKSLALAPLIAVMIFLGWFINIETGLLPSGKAQKEMTLMLDNSEGTPMITESRWSAFGRVDVVESENPFFKTMFIDGAAGTKMLRYTNRKLDKNVEDNLLFNYMGGLPLFAFYQEGKRPGNALVLGSGGGIDVVTLLLFGYQDIKAVEINKGFIDVVREQKEYTGGIYSGHPEIEVVHSEGRSYIRNSGTQYNLIHMSLPIIKSARNYGNYALTENYLFTHEAISEYREALKPDGALLVVTHYKNEVLRLLSSTLKSFETEGIPPEEALKQVALVGSDANPAIVIKNSRFTDNEIKAFYTVLERYNQRGSTNFIPGLEQRYKTVINREEKREEHVPAFHPDIYAMAKGKLSLEEFAASGDENIAWVSDRSPFFYQMQKFLPREVMIVLGIVLLFIAGLIVFFKFKTEGVSPPGHRFFFFSAFSLLGTGYILIEIRVLQQFIVYWRHQTLALAVVLSIVLISTGAGSLVSTRIRKKKIVSVVLLGIIAAAGGITFLFQPVLRATEVFSFAVKLLITFGLIFPVFFFMGMPFPYFLQQLGNADRGRALYPWVLGANSIATLFGGVLSIVVAMTAGFPWVLAAGCGAYGTVLVLWTVRGKRLGADAVSEAGA